ncbi:helix-turn-helix domain-containing protein [Streptomyces sp. NPDC091271]|uniref:helix-turn-helix domain-containing protein n=1 Tax=Streptomyces sp. NPDC091271 TaxID=3365980 RepID=UPI0038149A4A
MADALRAPQQDRSRDKLERIYEVSVELLVEGGWDAVTVGSVERRSGVSRGAFYLRFPNREALLDYTRKRLIATVGKDQDAAFERARTAGAETLDVAVVAAVEAIAHVFRRHGPALLRLDRQDAEREAEKSAGAKAMNRLSQEFRSVLEPLTGTDQAWRTHLEFATEIVFSMLVLRSRPRVTFSEHTRRDWDTFIHDVSDAVTDYLGARIPPAARGEA